MFKKILIGIIIFGIVAILLLQIDDDLDPGVAVYIEQAKPVAESEAYHYLLGILTAETEEPSEVGKQRLISMLEAQAIYKFGDIIDSESYPEDKKLALPDGDVFCNGWEVGCWEMVFSKKESFEQILLINAKLRERYQKFVRMGDYQTLTKASMDERYPPFEYLVKANRLSVLEAINEAGKNNPEQAIEILMSNIRLLRNQLKQADNFIGKLVFTIMISENVDVISLLARQQKVVLNSKIIPLTAEERNFEKPLIREFVMGYQLYMNMDKDPKFFSPMPIIPQWLVRAVFKPNMTINEYYTFFRTGINHSQLDQAEFAVVAANNQDDEQRRLHFSKLRNYVGDLLNSISRPNYDSFSAKLFDLNAKIAIFNQTMNKAELPVDLYFIQNPYYETNGTAFYSEDGKRICLTGPLEDTQNQRCLRVTLYTHNQ